MSNAPTKKATDAARVLRVAKSIEDGHLDHKEGACCLLLSEFHGNSKVADNFYHLFKPKEYGCELWWGILLGRSDAERRDGRILALCFMAAMVEAGDA